VVFLVAVPLCLGIALACGAPLFSGIIAGVVGGLVVGAASGSALGVSGPAAGLAVIVLAAITALGSFQAFLLSVVLAGVIQIALGYARAGAIAYYFPSSVIKGMLTGIGLTIMFKQLPHAVGYDSDSAGNLAFAQSDGENTLSAIAGMFSFIQPGALLVAMVSLALLVLWEQPALKRSKLSLWIQGPLVAVVVGIVLNAILKRVAPGWAIGASHLVQIPTLDGLGGALAVLTFPDFRQLGNPAVYTTALTVAVVASLETLLCVEATDKLDPQKRITPADRELKAQGLGNLISGLLGGLPLTQVIVRSSANIQSGARSKLSAILHGVLLLAAVLTIPALLNRIPLAVLASILLTVGYKLAKPALFVQMYRQGPHQFVPFAATVAGILGTDLLVGIGLGMAVAAFSILLTNYRNPYFVDGAPGAPMKLVLSEHVTFLHRAAIIRALDAIPSGAKLTIDASRTTARPSMSTSGTRPFFGFSFGSIRKSSTASGSCAAYPSPARDSRSMLGVAFTVSSTPTNRVRPSSASSTADKLSRNRRGFFSVAAVDGANSSEI
jgi:MFS superfamily sulfate permease-like transporter